MGGLAQRVADQLVALHARREEGRITRAEFVDLATAFLDAARARAVAVADLALAAELSVLRSRIVATIGLEPLPEPLRPAVEETLASEPYRAAPAAAVAVLGRAVTLQATQDAYAEGMRRHGVELWERVTDTGACEVCRDLARRGPASTEVSPWHHKGCGCSTRPVA